MSTKEIGGHHHPKAAVSNRPPKPDAYDQPEQDADHQAGDGDDVVAPAVPREHHESARQHSQDRGLFPRHQSSPTSTCRLAMRRQGIEKLH
ncbi:MAG TPA: hypothetical protein VEQ60_13910, partial [Longimicrobium sp.]|nr:hypothetical protein [Longimicrobium sp.]